MRITVICHLCIHCSLLILTKPTVKDHKGHVLLGLIWVYSKFAFEVLLAFQRVKD